MTRHIPSQPSRKNLPLLIVMIIAMSGFAACEPRFNDQQCESFQDCFPGEFCVDGLCVETASEPDAGQDVLVLEDVETPEDVHTPDAGPDVGTDAGLNACGGSTVLDDEPGDPCGPCLLDTFTCDGTEAVICDGATACPDLDFVTYPAEDIEANAASLRGELRELPIDAIEAHGFCWSAEPEPGFEDDCVDLGPIAAAGEFFAELDALAPGQTHYARAFATIGEESFWTNVVNFTTLAPTPSNFQASEGTEADKVVLTWDPVPGATGYLITRDTHALDTIDDGDQDVFEDVDAIAGTLAAPTNVAATATTTAITLSWESAAVTAASRHDYTIVALYPDATSEASAAVTGYVEDILEITGYEVSVDDGPWDASPGLATTYADTDAPRTTIVSGPAAASEGGSSTRVHLSVVGHSVTAALDASYRVRAVASDTAGAASVAVVARRAIGALQFQWERTSADADDDADYSPIAGAIADAVDHTPEDASARYYRVVLSADGADPAVSAASRGYLATLPEAVTSPATDITSTTAKLQGQIPVLGDPLATAAGSCVSTAPEPSFENGADCRLLASTPTEGTFEHLVTDLDPGTTYYARAFVRTDLTLDGLVTRYGDTLSFETLLCDLEGLGDPCTAGIGECLSEGQYVCNTEGTGLVCDAVPGAASAEVCDGRDNDCDGIVDNGVLCEEGLVCTAGNCVEDL